MVWLHGIVLGLLPCLTSAAAAAAAGQLQNQTNGGSVLRTRAAPQLPHFLTDNPLPQGFPWGGLTANGTNAYTTYPTTGVIRSYEWTISRGVLAPDGYEMPVILVNGQFPGPTVEANWGDTIQVTVHNNIQGPEEGTSIHWHGVPQSTSPWEDGVPAVTQCPIAPGSSFTYQFQATVYGISWYHSHYSAQYGAGLLGPLVIYGPTQEPYDVDVGPVLLSDWYHIDYFKALKIMLAPGGKPEMPSDNNLINGKNNFDCTTKAAGDKTSCTNNAGQAEFFFETGKVHRLRLANTGSEGIQSFSIDSHMLKVIAYDYVPIEAYETEEVILGIGQRADVLVTANQGAANASFWMRSTITKCSTAKQPHALAAIHYTESSSSSSSNNKNNERSRATASNSPYDFHSLPKTPRSNIDKASPSGSTGGSSSGCANDDLSLTMPLYVEELPPPPPPSWTHNFDIELFVNASNVTLWKFDGISFRGDYNAPMLLLASLGNTSWPAEWNARNLYANSSVRMIVNNHSPSQHPMHLHGSDFYVLHEGPGSWDGTIVRPSNPMRRDVQLVRPGGHLVLQMNANNPGVWPFHCHIAWHASGGFLSQLIVKPDAIKDTKIPSVMAKTCRDWAAWTGTHVPD